MENSFKVKKTVNNEIDIETKDTKEKMKALGKGCDNYSYHVFDKLNNICKKKSPIIYGLKKPKEKKMDLPRLRSNTHEKVGVPFGIYDSEIQDINRREKAPHWTMGCIRSEKKRNDRDTDAQENFTNSESDPRLVFFSRNFGEKEGESQHLREIYQQKAKNRVGIEYRKMKNKIGNETDCLKQHEMSKSDKQQRQEFTNLNSRLKRLKENIQDFPLKT
jgi:hypothetical protein